MPDKIKILKHYVLFKKSAESYFEKNNIEKSVKYINLAAQIGYNYNFQYCDDDLEDLISKISLRINPNSIKFQTQENRIVFYDSFGNNRVLAMQYIRAIISMDLELLYIFSSNSIDKDLEKEINNYSKSEIIKLDKNSFEENVSYALSQIAQFAPKTIIEHFLPWDILGFCICNDLKSSKRYFINLTDHAYWLGKKCADYFLEFRNFGFYLSHFQRHIPIDKLIFQPYYPLQNNATFLGFPKEVTSDKIILFSVSDFYKIFGKDGHFFKMVRRILSENDNAIFLLAGNGDFKPIKSFIKKNKLQNRFILLGFRNDINEVIKRIDIYINTYPLIGGLMSQYAAVNHKPIIGYTDENLYSFNDTEDLLQTKNKGTLVRNTIDDFHINLNELIEDKNVRSNNIFISSNCVITPEKFNNLLSKNLSYPEHMHISLTDNIRINLDSIFELYYDMEINFLKQHYITIWAVLNSSILWDHFSIGYISFIHKVVRFIKLRL